MTTLHQPDMTLSELWNTYVNENPRIRSDQTKLLMRGTVQRYQEFLGRPGTVADLSNANLVAFMEYRKQLTKSPRTIEREVSKLATIWRYAASRGWCETPRFSVAKCSPPTPTAWSPAEMKIIFEGAAEYKSRIGGMYGGVVMTALLRLAYDTGERAAAIQRLAWADVDLDGRWVKYRAETRKGGVSAGDNLQRITRQSVAALTALRNEWQMAGKESLTVFPNLHYSSFYGH